MTKVVAVISGKGGVGKTTIAINTAAALINFGRTSVVVDGDLHAPNVGMHLGSPALPITLNHVLNGEYPISKATYLHQSGVRVVPASIAFIDANNARHEDIHIPIDALRPAFDLILIDSPSGLGKESRSIMAASDSILAVTTPDLVSVTDTLKSIHLAKSMGKEIVGVVVNQLTPGSELSLSNIATLMELPVLTCIPHDASIIESLRLRHPVVHSHADSLPSIRFKELAALLTGDTYQAGTFKEGF